MGLVHEVGHATVCISQGGSFPYEMFFQLSVVCTPLPSPIELFWSTGGIFGLAASITPLTVSKIRSQPVLVGGLAGSAVFQFLYFVAETWMHFSYMGNDPYLFLAISLVVLLSVFYFSRKADTKIKKKS
jgi:hypothetical protein